MHRLKRKCWYTDRDIIGALLIRSRVADPITRGREEALSSLHFSPSSGGEHPHEPTQHPSVFIKLGSLTRPFPATGAHHTCDAERGILCIQASDVLGDLFRRVTRRDNHRRSFDQAHTHLLALTCEEQQPRALVATRSFSSSCGDHVEVFSVDNRDASFCTVVCRPQRFQFLMKSLPARGIQLCEGEIRWAVVEPENVHHLRWRKWI